MSRHNYAQIPVAEAHDDDHNSSFSSSQPSITPQPPQPQQQQQQRRATSPLSSSRRSNGYSALQDAVDDDDEQEHEHDEHDAFLGQSHPLASSSAASSGRRRVSDEISLAPPASSTPASSSRASTPGSSRRVIGSGNDGVFANLSAKPRVEKLVTEELPPPYKQAALDATPAYYETTVNTPDYLDDDVLVEGLPVGNIYGFFWNFIVSMSFQFVGFFLTYLLHTSHSTKNGSKAGLGVTFITMGIQMMNGNGPTEEQDADTGYMYRAGQSLKAMTEYIWLSYIMLALGSFLFLRSIYDFARVKRTEMIINATSSQARDIAGTSETAQRGSDDEPAATTVAFIDLEAGFAATRLNNAINESNSTAASLPNAFTSPPPPPASASAPTTENAPSPAPTEGNVRRDHVITLLV
ncbi:hypothetical protein BGZ73_005419 [Actinomortierella ambigua]|nr:hypothetical protein BGZ73_005419 [Actinomortierella ambigua]